MAIERACFPGEAYTLKMFLELYEECGDWFFVAKRRGRLAGYVVACQGTHGAEIVSIAVAPEHRGAGVGRTLLAHILRCLRKARIGTLELMVRTTSTEAIRLYESFGMVRTGMAAHYYQDGGDAFRMRLRL